MIISPMKFNFSNGTEMNPIYTTMYLHLWNLLSHIFNKGTQIHTLTNTELFSEFLRYHYGT